MRQASPHATSSTPSNVAGLFGFLVRRHGRRSHRSAVFQPAQRRAGRVHPNVPVGIAPAHGATKLLDELAAWWRRSLGTAVPPIAPRLLPLRARAKTARLEGRCLALIFPGKGEAPLVATVFCRPGNPTAGRVVRRLPSGAPRRARPTIWRMRAGRATAAWSRRENAGYCGRGVWWESS